MNALRHVTYRAKDTWVSQDDLVLTKTLGERIRYIRENLVDERGVPMTQPAFAELIGLARGHHGVMAYEKGKREPKPRTRELIAALAGGTYDESVFSRRGAELIVVRSAVPRLATLEAEAVRTKHLAPWTRVVELLTEGRVQEARQALSEMEEA